MANKAHWRPFGQFKLKSWWTIKTCLNENTDNTRCSLGCEATGSLIHCGRDWGKIEPLWRQFGVPYEGTHILVHNPAMLLLGSRGIDPTKMKTFSHKHVHKCLQQLYHNCQETETTKCSKQWVHRQLGSIRVIECYSVIKRDKQWHMQQLAWVSKASC